jgi:hypothetical protein
MNEIVIEGNKGKKFVIDLSDYLQRRYELVRELKLSESPKEDICAKYGHCMQKADKSGCECDGSRSRRFRGIG